MSSGLPFVRLSLGVGLVSLLAATSAVGQTARYDDEFAIQGFSQPYRQAAVASPISGIVSSRDVREGQTAIAGQCLVRLDSAVHDARLQSAKVAASSKGDVAIAKSELQVRLNRLSRVKQLATRSHATQIEVSQAHEDVTIARASLLRAEERVKQQEAEYLRLLAESEQHRICAPFSGVIVEFDKQIGEYVGPGEATVCTLADLSRLSVEFMLPSHLRKRVQLDSKVGVVFTTTGKTHAGSVQFVSPYPRGDSQTYTVKVVVDNKEGKLNAGVRCLLRNLDD
ncbi:MAG TPA: hypothetical protein DDW52_18535 [Planctomycetaceae bacterium]|nr:hypothetical protein [Planctomycetaceae bacterium]